jgi:hypothetical protein
MQLTPWVVSWVGFTTVVITLAIYRKVVAVKEDDFLHVSDANLISQQAQVAHRLELIDRWGKILTAVSLLWGFVLLGIFLYQGWQQSLQYSQE